MKKIKIILLIIITLLLTGCYNYRELNTIAITSAIGIDKEDDEYVVNIQIINTIKDTSDTNASGDKPKFIVYEVRGKTLQEAMREIVTVSSRRTYVEHMSLMIIGEDLAYEGIEEIFDLFFRDAESRKQFLVAISKDRTAKELLEILTPIETINAKKIATMIETNSKYYGMVTPVTFEEVVGNYLDPNQEITIPYLYIKGTGHGDNVENLKDSDVEVTINTGGTALFKGTKLDLYLTEEESISYNFMTNNLKRTILTLKCDDENYMSAEVLSAKADTKASLNKASIEITGKANINEINCNYDLEKEEDLKKLQKLLNEHLEKITKKTTNKIYQEYQIDGLNLRNSIYKNNPDYWKKIKDKWNNSLKDLDFKITSNIELNEKGNGLKVITNE